MMALAVVLGAVVAVTGVTSFLVPADHDAAVTDRWLLGLSAPSLVLVVAML